MEKTLIIQLYLGFVYFLYPCGRVENGLKWLNLFFSEDESTESEAQESLLKSSNDNKDENALQKSIQKATKVLDLSSTDNDRAGGESEGSLSDLSTNSNCDSTRRSYGYPTLHFANGTSENVRQNMNLSVEICANPPVDHIIWQLPLETSSGQLLKPGQQSIDSSGLILKSVQANATCFHVTLFAQKLMPNGNHLILFMNRLGYQQRRIQVQVLKSEQQRGSQQISQCDSVRPLHFMLLLCQIFYHTFR